MSAETQTPIANTQAGEHIQQRFAQLRQALEGAVVGQNALIEQLLIALLCDGHVLLEGPPGLAKTRTIATLGTLLEGSFQRIQFTPDLLPADVTGSEFFDTGNNRFEFRQGPLFNNLVLADEINRAPAKVQSALLEAMAERQVTVAGRSYPLAEFFMVLATQNPIEQEGTYPLPEAQLDRFLLHLRVDYPGFADEKAILQLVRDEQKAALAGRHEAPPITLTEADLHQAREQVLSVYMQEHLEDYLISLVLATRHPEKYDPQLQDMLVYGASPRATLALDRAARAHAWLNGHDFVSPENIQAVSHAVLRHRIGLSYNAEAMNMDADGLLTLLLGQVAVP
ncbi:MAG: MoxR family ATPase [Marinobacterium sp.]|nr:MoxR family ATPase [Marinobacterium sp.]